MCTSGRSSDCISFLLFCSVARLVCDYRCWEFPLTSFSMRFENSFTPEITFKAIHFTQEEKSLRWLLCGANALVDHWNWNWKIIFSFFLSEVRALDVNDFLWLTINRENGWKRKTSVFKHEYWTRHYLHFAGWSDSFPIDAQQADTIAWIVNIFRQACDEWGMKRGRNYFLMRNWGIHLALGQSK